VAINPDILARHIEDFNLVTGNATNRFTCPISLRECETQELIDGHILNEALVQASRKTVIQYKDVDNFYGTAIEPGFIRYWNLKTKSFLDQIRENKNVRVCFPDGSELTAFPADSTAARKARGIFPSIVFRREGMRDINLFVKTKMDDPRLLGVADLETTARFVPAHVIGAMLKAAYLTFFDLIGYKAVYGPFGDTLRRTLNGYYQDRASTEDAPRYFSRYRNAVKFLMRGGMRSAAAALAVPSFDTLNHGVFWLHRTPARLIFAATCLFKINDVTVTVTIPECDDIKRAHIAVESYERLLGEKAPVPHTVHAAKIDKGVCLVEERVTPIIFGVPPEWESGLNAAMPKRDK